MVNYKDKDEFELKVACPGPPGMTAGEIASRVEALICARCGPREYKPRTMGVCPHWFADNFVTHTVENYGRCC